MNAIYTWGVARALGGRVLLRIEDHDRIRCRPEYDAALLEDLDWLGFVADSGRTPVLRQSDSAEVYAEALERLRQTHDVYVCACSRKAIGGERYDGRCRHRGLAHAAGRGLRVQLESGVERIDDALLGRLVQVPADQCGDILLQDRDGHWTYQFAATCDDLRQGVTLVIRGEDLAASTGRQVALARMLGRERPAVFLHHPLIVKGNGEKLSKASGDTGVREMRQRGVTAPEVIGHAAAAVDLLPSARPMEAARVMELFTSATASSGQCGRP